MLVRLHCETQFLNLILTCPTENRYLDLYFLLSSSITLTNMTKQNQRHDNANVGVRPEGIKFKPSVTKRVIDILEYTDEIVKEIKAVNRSYVFLY